MAAHNGALQLLADIENTRDDDKRRTLLRQACDLFDTTKDSLSKAEAEIFDDILDSLTKRVDATMRGEVSQRIAVNGGLLRDTVRTLALDDEIDVARPVLEKSDSLSDETLVEVAQNKGQAHMAAIALRPSLTESVTDTLVELGDNSVLRTVAGNAGAKFSNPGMSKLTDRAREDETLQMAIAERADISPAQMERLVDIATATVRQALQSKNIGSGRAIEEARAALEKQLGIDRIDFLSADRRVRMLLRKQKADESLLRSFALQGMFAELVVAISIMMQLNHEQAKQIMLDPQPLLIASRANEFSVETVKAFLSTGPAFGKIEPAKRRMLLEEFEKMSSETAQRVLRFWRTRQKLAAA
jgi:uncharacterized protein (DUF2336 family)